MTDEHQAVAESLHPPQSAAPPASSPSAQAQTNQPAVVQVSTPVFWLCWWSVLLLHAITSVFVLCAAAVHLVLSLPEAHDNTAALLLSIPLKRIAGLSYLVVTLMHVVALTQMVVRSARYRRLLLHKPTRNTPGRTSKPPALPPHHRLQPLVVLRRAWGQVFSSTGFLGIHSRFFHLTFLLRELVEILMQSYQLWSLSYSVSRVWINEFAVAAVVVNCWSIPLVNFVFHKRETTRRFMHVIVDMYLDFVCTVAVPVLILAPHVLAFNWIKHDFPAYLLVDDVWFANSVADGRQVLVTTYMDYFSSLLPQYGIFSCLRLIKRMVRRRGPEPLRIRHHHTSSIAPRSPSQLDLQESTQKPPDEKREEASTVALGEARGVRLVSVCLAIWGIAMLTLHARARGNAGTTDFPGCRLHLRPWFATNVSCSVMLIHCGHHDTTGGADDLAVILAQLERPVLTRLVFAHCPQLTVPSTIVEFPRLSSILVFNSTITSWPRTAAITQASHPVLVNIHIHDCNLLAGFPEGLGHSDLPTTLINLVISNSSLGEIPETVGDQWATSQLRIVRFLGTQLNKLPLSLAKLPLKRLSLSRNAIDEIDSGMFANAQFESLHLSGNPLTKLPEKVGDTSRLYELFVEHTDVSSLPAWVVDWAAENELDNTTGTRTNRVVSFFGSPVCAPGNNQIEAAHLPLKVCDRDWGTRNGPASFALISTQYPIE